MANVVNTAGSGQEEETTGSTPLSTGGDSGQPTTQDTGVQFSGDSGQPLDTGASAVEAAQTQTTSKAAPKASSGMFTNIQRYVEKNRPQAQAMGKSVKQDVEKKAGDIRSAVQGAQEKLGQDIKRAEEARSSAQQFASEQIGRITGVDPSTGQQVLTGTPTQQTGARTTQRVESPGLMPTEEAQGKYQSLLGDDGLSQFGYVAPQIQDLSRQILDAKYLANRAKQAATEQGRQNLLKETFREQGDYTRGMSGLDQLIMAGDPDAMKHVTDVQQIGQQLMLGSGVDDPTTPFVDESLGIQEIGSNLTSRLDSEQRAKAKLLADIKTQFDTAVTSIEDPITGEGGKLEKAIDFQKSISEEFAPGSDLTISKQVADALGLTETSKQVADVPELSEINLYGVDPTQYYSALETPTAAGVMSQSELDKLKALAMLAGKDTTLSGFDQVGGYDPSASFDIDAFKSAIAQKESELKIPEWEAAQTAMDTRDALAQTVSSTESKYGTKDISKLPVFELYQLMGKDKAQAYMSAKEQLAGAQRAVEDASKSIYGAYANKPITDAGLAGIFGGIGGAGTSALDFSKRLSRSDIEAALNRIKELQKSKLEII